MKRRVLSLAFAVAYALSASAQADEAPIVKPFGDVTQAHVIEQAWKAYDGSQSAAAHKRESVMAEKIAELSEDWPTSYESYLQESFQGEVSGEALFRTMAELCEEPAQVRKLRALEQLERETKEALRPAVREAGLSSDDDPKRIAHGEKLGAHMAKTSWDELMRSFQEPIEHFAKAFERAESLAPPGKEALFKRVTAHERALCGFVERELAGSPNSLEPLLTVLEKRES